MIASSLQSAVSSLLPAHLGAWHDPPSDRPPPGAPGAYTREPYDEDPMPDYENVLTD